MPSFLLLALLSAPVAVASTHATPAAQPALVELVVDAPMMSEDELPDEGEVVGEPDAIDRQDNLNKAIIVAIAIAAGSLVASFGALICCCCFYLGYYY